MPVHGVVCVIVCAVPETAGRVSMQVCGRSVNLALCGKFGNDFVEIAEQPGTIIVLEFLAMRSNETASGSLTRMCDSRGPHRHHYLRPPDIDLSSARA